MHVQTRPCRAGQLIDGRPPVLEVQHHLRRHLWRKGRDPLRSNSVVSCEHNDLWCGDTRLRIAAPRGIPLRDVFQPPERGGGFGQLAIARDSIRLCLRIYLRHVTKGCAKPVEIRKSRHFINPHCYCVGVCLPNGAQPTSVERPPLMTKSDPLRQIWLAAVLLTRLPMPHLPPQAFVHGPQAVWAYPLVGAGIGLAGVAVAQAALVLGLPYLGAAALGLAAMMLVTGGMHEDGLADLFDGFWGGFTPERRLEIMRDSQIGTYGVLALVVVFTLRLVAVAALLDQTPLALVAAAALSRAGMPVVMAALPAARRDGLSRSVGQPPITAVAVGLGVALVIALLCLGAPALLALLVALAVTVCMTALAKAKIRGQTGDVLGAIQQLSEAAILLTCTALL